MAQLIIQLTYPIRGACQLPRVSIIDVCNKGDAMNSLDPGYVNRLFAHLETGEYPKFFEHVADDVRWRVMGTHPLAGVYRSKSEFIHETFERLNKCLSGGVRLKVSNLLVQGNIAVVEMESISTARNGKPFNNTYCWIVEFDGEGIVRNVKAYVDSALVQNLLDENEKSA